MSVRRTRVAVALLVAAVALALVAWFLALTAAPVTAPRHLVGHRADGTPQAFRGCSLADVYLDMALWNGGVILPCRDQAFGTGWAFLDPRSRSATLRWPSPAGADEMLTLGLVPGPDQQLAILFQQAIEGDFFVGIARPEGWARPPVNLGKFRYKAAAWVGAGLEVVVAPVSNEDRYGLSAGLRIITLDGAGRQERTAIPACGKDCLTPQIVYRAAGRWVFEGADGAVTEGGKPVAPAFAKPAPYEDTIDLVADGRLATPATLSLGRDTVEMGADGQPAHAAPPPWEGLKPVRQNRFVIDGVTRRRPQWGDQDLHGITEQVGDRTLTWHTDGDDLVRITDARAPGGAALSARIPVARWSQGLASRMFVADGGGGYWLVDSTGDYLHLDRALHRTDPLSLREHLRPMQRYQLCWALFGLPILLVVCAGLSLRRQPRRPLLRAGPLGIAAALYLATAGWALASVARFL